MKNHSQNDICLYCPALSRQSTAEGIFVLGSTAIVGFVGLLATLNR